MARGYITKCPIGREGLNEVPYHWMCILRMKARNEVVDSSTRSVVVEISELYKVVSASLFVRISGCSKEGGLIPPNWRYKHQITSMLPLPQAGDMKEIRHLRHPLLKWILMLEFST